MSVSTISVNCDGTMLASGGRDQKTIVWDIEKVKAIKKSEIYRNVITYHKFLKSNPNLFIQTSEDLKLRLWDLRVKTPFKA